ncbi:MAG: hypothetical protein HY304_04430 [candidate division Zixibacteria bacterium]|nr:hypothetical protein [candidate division Zixibacteria bacterium]
MARLRYLMAISLALSLVMLPVSVVRADDPNPNSNGYGNPQDGHPWDDGLTNGNDPGPGSDTQPQGLSTPRPPSVLHPSIARVPGGAAWIADAIWSAWRSVIQSRMVVRQKTFSSRYRR